MNGPKQYGSSGDGLTSGEVPMLVRTAHAAFPLTPALSIGEKENPPLPFSTTKRGVCPMNLANNRTCRRLFPLPVGEGKGEGNRGAVRYRHSDDSRNCRTLRVLRLSRRFPETIMSVRTVAGATK